MVLRLCYLSVLLASSSALSKANFSFSTSSTSSTTASTSSSESLSFTFPVADASEPAHNTTNVHPSSSPNPPLVNSGKNQTYSGAINNTAIIPVTYKNSTKKMVAYYPTYNYDLTPLSEINYDLYDELIFFTATTTKNFTIGTGELKQTHWDSMATEFVTRCKDASVIPVLALGGYSGSIYFSNLVATAENRTAYANSLVDFAKSYKFEGINIIWEWPNIQEVGCNSVREEDLENLASFLEELRKTWPEVYLTAASSIEGWRDSSWAPASADRIARLAKALDRVMMMTFDVYGDWSGTTGPLAPFSDKCADSEHKVSVETSFEIYLKQGFSPSQLLLGIPTYARSFSLANAKLVPKTVNGNYTTYYYQNFTSTPPGGIADDEPGFDVCGNPVGNGGTWMVKELVENGWLSDDMKKGRNGYVLYQDECSGVPFLVGNKTLISYDDTSSSVRKARWARESGLSGLFFFDAISGLDQTISASRDELLGVCT